MILPAMPLPVLNPTGITQLVIPLPGTRTAILTGYTGLL